MNRVVDKGGVLVQQYVYGPGVEGDSFQSKISTLLHEIVATYGEFTLSELGYLHINSLSYDQKNRTLHLRVYFDATCASRTHKAKTKKGFTIEPITELNVFRNFLFVGDLNNVVSYEKIVAPRYEVIEKDELGRRSVKFKHNKKFDKTQALVLNCNLALTAAASHNLDLLDPEFSVSCKTVGKSSKKDEKNVMSTMAMEELPVIVTINSTAKQDDEESEYEYDPSEAESYLLMIQDRMSSASGNKKKLEKKVRNKTKGSGNSKKSSAGFNKYS